MNTQAVDFREYQAISQVLEIYIDGARQGKGEVMKAAFHPKAMMFGYMGGKPFSVPIQGLFDFTDGSGPAKNIRAQIVHISVAANAAQVQAEVENWNGDRYTDMFNLLKVEGVWKIVNKVYHLYA